MHEEGKVVPLAAAIDRAGRMPLPGLPLLLLQVRDKAALQLRQGLQALFDNADDALFEMADKTNGSVAQHLYFEAMRDLRLKRKSIERGFLDIFYEQFSRIGQAEPLAQLALAGVAQARVHPERDQAIALMVDRVLSRDGFALAQLGQRFEALLEQPLDNGRNPLEPTRLCEYFLEAGRNLGVGPQVKLILLKLFERYVLRDTDLLYGEANQALAAAGVLAELPAAPRRRAEDRRLAARRSPAALAANAGIGSDEAGLALFASLQGLLAPLRGRLAPRVQSVASAQSIGTADLLRLLTHLQHYVPSPLDDEEFQLGPQLEQLLLRVSVRSGMRRRIHTDDEDVITLVGLLFAHIEADDNLPPSLRSLIARLHIPLLKVALIDKGLFSRPNHAARRLLNEIAAMAIGWESAGEGQRDSLQLRVERVIQRLLNDFAEDPELFAELLSEFLAFSTEERRRNELLEQRTRDAEEGRARAMQAREQVEQVLDLRLRGRRLPQALLQMLVHGWSQVLMLAWLKHGEGSAAWEDGVATLDTLLASIAPHPDEAARLNLLQQVPGLLKALREGLSSVALDSVAVREFFLQLERLHLRACAEPGAWDESFDEVLVEHPVRLMMAHDSTAAPALADIEQSPQARQVQRLRIGTWIEVIDDGAPLRCKLVARIDSSDRLVFANRTGMKVSEWTSQALAAALRRGEARVLDDGLLFERALEAVIEGLKR